MKKLHIIILALCLLLVTTACTKTEVEEEGLTLVGVNFPTYDLLRTITKGSEVSVSMLLPSGVDNHDYEPTPKDIIKLSKADLIVYVGGESDEWMKGIIKDLPGSVHTFALIDKVEAVNEIQSDYMSGVEEDSEIDEHVWTSLSNEQTLALKLCETLCSLDPDNKELYLKNTEDFVSALSTYIKKYEAVIESAKRHELLFADRFPLSHFVSEFNLDFYAAFPGCVHESEPSAKTVAFLIDKVKEDKIPVVFHIELSNEKLAKLIASETGAKVLEWNTAHNLTKQQFDSGLTYLDIVKSNLEVLSEALN